MSSDSSNLLFRFLLSILLQATLGTGDERIRSPNEIIPVSAENSNTWHNDDDRFGALLGIDADWSTKANTQIGSDPYASYTVKFDGMQCIDSIHWYIGKPEEKYSMEVIWNCDKNGCGKCTGFYGKICENEDFKVEITAEDSSTEGLPSPENCIYGDSFKLQHNNNMFVQEIAFIGNKVELEVNPCEEEIEKLEKALQEEELKVAEANVKIAELENKLEQVEIAAECPGIGIWKFPSELVGKRIGRRRLRLMKERGETENLKYLSSFKGTKISKDLAKYIECFLTVEETMKLR